LRCKKELQDLQVSLEERREDSKKGSRTNLLRSNDH